MVGSEKSKLAAAWRAITWQTAVGVTVAIITGALVPEPKSFSIEGGAEVLGIVFVLTAIALGARIALQVYAGYVGRGLGWWVLFHILVLLAWVAMAVCLITAQEPRLLRILIFGAAVAILFFFGATRMEERRAELIAKTDIELKRATAVLRDSRLWGQACRGFRRIDGTRPKRFREAVSQPDNGDGFLSWGASLLLLIPVTIVVIAAFLGIVSVVFPHESDQPVTEKKQPDPQGRHPAERSRRFGGRAVGSTETSEVSVDGEQEGEGPGSEADCALAYDPGPAVPEPARSALALGWRDVDGLIPGDLEALGGDTAGCPGPGRPVPGLADAWYATGHCGDELRALVVALPGFEHPVVLFEQAAEFALPLIREGEFVGAVDRFVVGEGDAYIVQSRRGPFVLIRDDATAGEVEDDDQGDGCGSYEDEDVAYTVAGPGLLEPWRSAAALALGGVYPIGDAHRADGTGPFVFRSGLGIVAEAHCFDQGCQCRARFGERGAWQDVPRGARIEPGEVVALAE